VICLHTDRRAPGAEAFWRAMPTTLVYDPRGARSFGSAKGEPFGDTLHFELDFPAPEDR
jgi:hypothetical protein